MTDKLVPTSAVEGVNQLRPANLSDDEAAKVGVSSGWWAVDGVGTPVFGPYPNEAAVIVAIPEKCGTSRPS